MIPLFVSTPERMLKVRVMTVKDSQEKTLKTLHRIGVLHVEEAKELKPADIEAIAGERSQVSELRNFVTSILSYVPEEKTVTPSQDVEVIYTRPFSEIASEVRELHNRLDKIHERTVKLGEESNELQELKRCLEPLAKQTALRLRDLNYGGAYLFSHVFVMPSDKYETQSDRLKGLLLESITTTVDNETIIYAIAKTSDEDAIKSIVADMGGRALELPYENIPLGQFLEATGARIRSLEEEHAKLREELRSKVKGDLERFVLLREALAAEDERLSVLEKAAEAKYVTLVEGWIPESDVEPTISALKEDIEFVFTDTRKPEPKEEPPTKMKNPARMRPFEIITRLFGTPKYGEWDPTPIVAYSFAFFFGLMAADVIYALGIIVLAKFLLPKFTDDPQSENFKVFQRMIYTSGVVALIMGVLSGSYLADTPQRFFGAGDLALLKGFGATLVDPLSFIVMALIIGLIHVNIAHILALIRGVRERAMGVIIAKVGLILLQLGIPLILHNILSAEFTFMTEEMYSISSYAMMLGIVCIAVGTIIQTKGMGAIMWLFEITGLLGDVMSYCRLAGVGLATYYLGQSFNMLAKLFSTLLPGPVGFILGTIVGIGILIFGHVMNIVLTGITGFVHSLRLCFVEFLFKFYQGEGRQYSPFKLRKRAVLPVTVKT